MHNSTTAWQRSPQYLVLFSTSDNVEETYDPFAYDKFNGEFPATVPHGLSREVATALPGLWYCLHLPNSFQQLVDIPLSLTKLSQELQLDHKILLLPIQVFDPDRFPAWPDWVEPALVVCPDELVAEAELPARQLGFPLPIAPYSTLSSESLRDHWRALHEKFLSDRQYLGVEPELTYRLDLAPSELPRKMLARQMGATSWDASGSYDDIEKSVRENLRSHLTLSAFARLEREGASNKVAMQRLPQVIAEESRKPQLPITLALPGVAPAYIRNAYTDSVKRQIQTIETSDDRDTWSLAISERPSALIERNAMEFAITHHAISRGGMGLMTSNAPAQAFIELAQLERHFMGKIKAPTVWKLLDRLDRSAKDIWSDSLCEAISRASMLTVFSNFPLGLLRMPGDTAPLSSRLPITYRSLIPLTRTLQLELATSPGADLSEKVDVLVAECISSDDPVGRVSRTAWAETKKHIEEQRLPITFEIEETLSIDRFRAVVHERRPHFLVVSAHGSYAPNANAAGLMIGPEFCMGQDLWPLPPVVILSACHVAPRGAGTVSITDLLLREGAIAVLGTQVPVDVFHNSIFMMRLIVNVAETLAQSGPFDNLLDLWQHVQGSNAVNDVINGNKLLLDWSMTASTDGSLVVEEFMKTRSDGRLRRGHVYEDTEVVLAEIADDQGMGQRVRRWFKHPGYVPESLFYVFTGRPERIYLRPPAQE